MEAVRTRAVLTNSPSPLASLSCLSSKALVSTGTTSPRELARVLTRADFVGLMCAALLAARLRVEA